MYILTGSVNCSWVGDGIGNMPGKSAQTVQVTIDFNPTGAATPTFSNGPIVVPGGDAPSGDNLTTASTSFGTELGVLFNNVLAQIQGFATGGA